MSKRMAISIISVAAAACLYIALKLIQDPACVRIQAKADLAEEFCDGLAAKAAQSRCESLSEDMDVIGQCMRVIVPSAHSACMSYIGMDKLRQQAKGLCQ